MGLMIGDLIGGFVKGKQIGDDAEMRKKLMEVFAKKPTDSGQSDPTAAQSAGLHELSGVSGQSDGKYVPDGTVRPGIGAQPGALPQAQPAVVQPPVQVQVEEDQGPDIDAQGGRYGAAIRQKELAKGKIRGYGTGGM